MSFSQTRLWSEIKELRESINSGRQHPKEAKVQLAKFFIERFHDKAAADKAEEEFNRIFVNKGLPDDVPKHSLTRQENLPLCRLMVDLNLADSNSEARRLIQGGGVQIREEKINDPQMKLNLQVGDDFVIRVGKKKFAKVVVQ